MGNLDGKTVLLTGGLRSLGRAQAAELAARGASVIVLDRPDVEGGADKAAALGPGVRFEGCDLADLEAARDRVRGLAESPGGIDVLINNAALIVNRPFEEFTLDEYQGQLRRRPSRWRSTARP